MQGGLVSQEKGVCPSVRPSVCLSVKRVDCDKTEEKSVLGATYDDHLRLIGKRVIDFLLVLIELLSLCVTAEALRANVDLKSAISFERGQFDVQFQVEGVAPTSHFCTDS